MKKFTLVVVLAFCSSIISAQTKVGGMLNIHQSTKKIEINKLNNSKALTDTLMWFDGLSFSINPIDAAAFDYLDSNMDANLTTTTNGYPGDWFTVYSTFAWDLQPTDVDTAWYLGATSWFDNDPAQSNDWFTFGPLTLPAGANAAVVTWKVKTNPTYRDGYEVKVSSTGLNNTDFTTAAIYTRADLNPSTTTSTDTIFQPFTANIPASFNGGHVYVAFHHNATGMDCLWLDDIRVIADNGAGINNIVKDNVTLYQNQPNPASHNTLVKYEIQNNSEVSLEIFDMTGRLIQSYMEGRQVAGRHSILVNAETLTKGAYYYSLTVDSQKLTKKMIVIQ